MNLKKLIANSLLLASLMAISISSITFAQTDIATMDVGTLTDGVLHVNANEAEQLLKDNPNIKVLDVRTGWEHGNGRIDGSENINYYSFSFRKSLEKLDKSVTWLVHCKSGVRSGKSLPIMQEAGFESIIHLDGGFDAWRNAGLIVTVD